MSDISKAELLALLNSGEKIVSIPLGKWTTYYGWEEYSDDSVVNIFTENVVIQSITEHNMEAKQAINLSTEWPEQL
jgi:hypothetical protein